MRLKRFKLTFCKIKNKIPFDVGSIVIYFWSRKEGFFFLIQGQERKLNLFPFAPMFSFSFSSSDLH